MAFIKNEKLENVNTKLQELKQTRQTLSDEISNINETLDQTFEYFATGQVTDEQIDEANRLLTEKKEEYAKNEQHISKVEGVRKKIRLEFIPFVKDQQKKKADELQKQYDDQLTAVEKKRNEYIQELAQLGAIQNEASNLTHDYNKTVRNLGGNETAGYSLSNKKLLRGQFTEDHEKTFGLPEQAQKDVLRTGNVPNFAKGDE